MASVLSTTLEDLWDVIIKEHRCHYCKGYLQYSPLRLLPNGMSICGHCEPTSSDLPVHRMLCLENILKKVTFPCRFKKDGCLERMPFGLDFGHETACEYRLISCFAPLCSWSGPVVNLSNHVLDDHEKYKKNKIEFRVNVKESSLEEEILFYEKDNVITIIKYCYKLDTMVLEYQILCILRDTPAVYYNVQLYSITNSDSYSNIKHIPYKYTTDKEYPLTKIKMKPYVDILNNPNTIVFSVKLMFENVDAAALALEECGLCGISITPSMFNDSPGEPFYRDCGGCNYIVEKAIYQCKWPNCKVVKNVPYISKHELQCFYRKFQCPAVKCKKTYIRKTAIKHLEKHGFAEFKNSTSFCFNIDAPKRVVSWFTIINDEVIIIQCTTDMHMFSYELKSTSTQVTVSVYLQHQDCQARSSDIIDGKRYNTEDIFRCCNLISEYTDSDSDTASINVDADVIEVTIVVHSVK